MKPDSQKWIGLFIFITMKQLKVGLTGGIGTGKSYVAKQLELKGFPVYYSDQRAKAIIENDLEVKQALIALLGAETYTTDGYNRTFVAQQLFANPSIRSQVNAIVHPAVRKDFLLWCGEQTAAIVFQESALLLQSDAKLLLDKIVVVDADESTRIGRIMDRDDLSFEQAELRVASQMEQEEQVKMADFVVHNGDFDQLSNEIEQLIAYLQNS